MSQREGGCIDQVSIESILGLKQKINTPLDLVELGNKGVLKSQIKHLGETMRPECSACALAVRQCPHHTKAA